MTKADNDLKFKDKTILEMEGIVNMDKPVEYLYFVYAELLFEGYVNPASVRGNLTKSYSGTVSRHEPIKTHKNYEEIVKGLAEKFGVADTERVVVKALMSLFSNPQ